MSAKNTHTYTVYTSIEATNTFQNAKMTGTQDSEHLY